MGKVRILEIKESVFADNDRQADQLRIRLKEKGVFLMNLMSSPGSGKTTTLKRTIAALKDDLRIGVMEADIDSDVDALAIAETGTERIITFFDAPVSNSAGQTRFPTFSRIARSTSSMPRPSIPCSVIFASR